ncbi:substrate-binding periplasmic protein [Pseudomonas vanderleydeniana]|uniref:Transporter substrate-binding domain-containing protein n=1 Tax=Pseudomonas vanderleydeniana TaxID=2745495 RepID=A0A9E6PKW8_9PSED|nr:transporter substrate-binding domain-containing protein [Pseudomonas vanderleydeniana]QXI27895.1 transporter substrate-binding domain-containing protein [Pseudomonas vanderleydeniana]
MSGCRVWGLLLLLLLSPLVRGGEAVGLPAQVRLVSEEWLDYTNADGSGLAWDVLREVFEPHGVKVEIRSEPYVRSVGLVQRGEADAWVGSYSREIGGVLYPRWNFDTDHIYSLGLASKPVPDQANLGDFRLAWVRGYKYQKYLPNVRDFNEIQRRDGILSMLQHGRVDFYIDALSEVEYVLGQAEDPKVFRSTHLAELPLYLGFADNERGRMLLALYDQRMGELVKSGRLRRIFEHWKQPYPFESGKYPVLTDQTD